MNSSIVLSEISPLSRSSKGTQSLVSLQKNRKLIESETQSLANRIYLLQKEENQIWKSLELAKTRAREVYLHKKRNVGRDIEGIRVSEKHKLTNSLGSESALLRRQRESNIKNLKEAIQKQRHDDMMVIKKQSMDCEKKKHDAEKAMQQEKQNQMVAIKKQEIIGTYKRKAFFDDRLNRLQNHKDKRVEEEELYKVEKEMELLNMEKMEKELLERIQKSKDLQKQVFKDLDKILTGPPTEQANDYFKMITAPPESNFPATTKSVTTNIFDGEDIESALKSQLQHDFLSHKSGSLPTFVNQRF